MSKTTRKLTGRNVIKVGESEITSANVVKVLKSVINTHMSNSSDIDYLYKYYRGEQPIMNRIKEVRPEICNKIVENRANEIVSFKVGYLCGEPIQYVSRNGDDLIVESINRLNELMFAEDKSAQDQEVIEWQMICGTAYRLVLPDKIGEVDDAPFEMYTLDPRNTFVVYSNAIGNKPIMGVKYVRNIDDIVTYSIYTENEYFEVREDKIIKHLSHALNTIPIFEYPSNNARLGAFEIVIPILDAINNVQSNRMDGVEQLIQSYMKFINCTMDSEEFDDFLKKGALMVSSTDGLNADVDMITNELNQSQVQTLKDDYYSSVLTICGIPNRNGGSSTSDTGSAVLLRDGWSLAEARAKDSEHMFKRSEKQMLKLVLGICRDLTDIDLHLSDIELKFTRRNYENIQSKAQVLTTMLNQPKIHPQLAFQHSGLFTDSESAYSMSMKYYDKQLQAVEVTDEYDNE